MNNNGGWCIVGWLRTGVVQDSSNAGTAQTGNWASIHTVPHISYLYPTNPGVVFGLLNYVDNKVDLSGEQQDPEEEEPVENEENDEEEVAAEEEPVENEVNDEDDWTVQQGNEQKKGKDNQ